jgi:deoxyadenosine/deoxycytidine kinase
VILYQNEKGIAWYEKMSMQIAISGNIGAGKTELTKLLSRHYGYKAVFGPSEENPYLNSFYEDMRRWSFNMMVHSLYANVKQLAELAESGESFVRDRSLYDDACVFAPNLQDMGLITSRDLDTYTKLLDMTYSLLPKPDLLIYVRGDVPTLIRNIQKRGREYESRIRLDYLTNLNNRYENWASSYKGKMLVVDTDEYDFVENRSDLGLIINKIDAEFNSLFGAETMAD